MPLGPGSIIQQAAGSSGTQSVLSAVAMLPDPPAAGTTLLLVVASNALVTTPAGMMLDRAQVNSAAHYHFRRVTPGGAGEQDWPLDLSAAGAVAWWVAEVDGVDPATPVDVPIVSSGTFGFGIVWPLGPSDDTSQADTMGVASWSSLRADVAVTASGYTGGFAELADVGTSRPSGDNVGLHVARALPDAVGPLATDTTFSAPVARTGVLEVLRGSLPPSGQAAPDVIAGRPRPVWAADPPTPVWRPGRPRPVWRAREPR